MNRERGSITIWVLGLVLLVLALGGLSIDLWRGVVARKAVAAVADAAAVAGASGIDEMVWRAGDLALDPPRAKALAERVILSEPGATELRWRIDVTSSDITVTVERDVDLTLLRIMDPSGGPLVVRVSATARPQVSG
jgi:Flp pilus assembly protein TadG